MALQKRQHQVGCSRMSHLFIGGQNGKIFMLFKGILYDFAYPIDLSVCSLLIENHQCIAVYAKTSQRIACHVTLI
jgi:hypothetical protein